MTMHDVKQAVDSLGRAFAEFRAANDEALRQKADRGAIDPATEHKIERINDELDTLRDRLDRTHAALNRSRAPAEARNHVGARTFDGAPARLADEPPDEHKAAFGLYVRKGDEAPLAFIERSALVGYGERKALVGYGERKALSVGADREGGYAVPAQLSASIIKTIRESSPLRAVAGVETIATDSLEMLVDKDEAGVGWVSETGTRAETTAPELAKIIIPVHEMYAEPRATQKLIDDASIDVEAWLAEKVAERFARLEASAFVNGNGVGQPRGVLTYPAGTAWGQIEQVNSGTSGAVTADGLINLQGALISEYAANASWVMNRLTLRDARKLKDSQGQYLWQPGLGDNVPESLLGRPIVKATDMPVAAASSLSVAFGDFKRGYQIVDRLGIRVLRDPFTAKPYVKFYTTKRVGGDVVNFDAIKLQKLAV
jgi:HK97 family phage major capsid protein